MEKLDESPEKCFSGEFTAAPMELNDGENDGEYFMEVEIKEEMVVEVMQELLKEINTCYEVKESPAPESFPAIMCSTSFGGDNERCGPVLSDSESRVMADVGVGPTKKVAAGEGENIPAGGGGGEEEVMEGGGDDDDDEWLDRVLSMDPQEFEDLDMQNIGV